MGLNNPLFGEVDDSLTSFELLSVFIGFSFDPPLNLVIDDSLDDLTDVFLSTFF